MGRLHPLASYRGIARRIFLHPSAPWAFSCTHGNQTWSTLTLNNDWRSVKHWAVSFLEEELKKSITALPKRMHFYFPSRKLLLKALPVQFFTCRKWNFLYSCKLERYLSELTHHVSVLVDVPFHQLSRARTVLVFPQDFDTQISKEQQQKKSLRTKLWHEKWSSFPRIVC